MNLSDLLILALATWRLSSLFAKEDGPSNIFARFRHWAGVRYDAYSNIVTSNVFAEGLVCAWCNSVWIGAIWTILYALYPPTVWVALPLALSVGAILVERIVGE